MHWILPDASQEVINHEIFLFSTWQTKNCALVNQYPNGNKNLLSLSSFVICMLILGAYEKRRHGFGCTLLFRVHQYVESVV